MDSANVHTVSLHKETFCNNGRYEALFGHLKVPRTLLFMVRNIKYGYYLFS